MLSHEICIKDLFFVFMCVLCLQCFDAVGWAAGRASSLSKTEWWGAGVVLCLERCVDLHMAQLMPLLLTVSCSNKIQIGFTFLVPADLGSPGQRAVKRVCVHVCIMCFMVSISWWRNRCNVEPAYPCSPWKRPVKWVCVCSNLWVSCFIFADCAVISWDEDLFYGVLNL